VVLFLIGLTVASVWHKADVMIFLFFFVYAFCFLLKFGLKLGTTARRRIWGVHLFYATFFFAAKEKTR